MSSPTLGAMIGAVLALTWITFGFWECVMVGIAMLIGAAIGRVINGQLDIRALADVFRGRRSSS